jgi:hypothetical protein
MFHAHPVRTIIRLRSVNEDGEKLTHNIINVFAKLNSVWTGFACPDAELVGGHEVLSSVHTVSRSAQYEDRGGGRLAVHSWIC